MRNRPLWLVCALAMSACSDEAPQTIPVSPQPTTGERLLAAPPPDWNRTFELDEEGVRLVEFMPPGSDPDAWIDKISFESFTAEELPDPINLLLTIAGDRERACSGFEDYNTFSGFENKYPTSVRLLFCHHQNEGGQGEITMLKSIQGNDAFYVIQRRRQVEPFTSQRDAPISEEEMGLWSLYLRSISVCDGTADHPCPST